jgi:hypothetical protein
MADLVLKSRPVFQLNFGIKLKVSILKFATHQATNRYFQNACIRPDSKLDKKKLFIFIPKPNFLPFSF